MHASQGLVIPDDARPFKPTFQGRLFFGLLAFMHGARDWDVLLVDASAVEDFLTINWRDKLPTQTAMKAWRHDQRATGQNEKESKGITYRFTVRS